MRMVCSRHSASQFDYRAVVDSRITVMANHYYTVMSAGDEVISHTTDSLLYRCY